MLLLSEFLWDVLLILRAFKVMKTNAVVFILAMGFGYLEG